MITKQVKIAAAFCISLLFAAPVKATLIGTDIDVLLTVGSNTVINQTVSVVAPFSFASGSFSGIDYSVLLPDGLPGSDDSSFTFVPFAFSDPTFVSDVSLTISSIAAGGPVIGLSQLSGFAADSLSFTASSVTVTWNTLIAGFPTYHFDIEIADAVETSAPSAIGVLIAGIAAIGMFRRKRK